MHDTVDGKFELSKRLLPALAVSAYLIGAWARLRYGLWDHPARHFVVSDAANMLEGMGRMISGGQTRWDTIWPPGQIAFAALLSRFDATLSLASELQVMAALGVPWLVADIAGQLAGRRGFWFGLAASALHVGLIHHVGFFLSESLFQATVVLAIWLTTCALQSVRSAQTASMPGWFTLEKRLGAAAGVVWGLATLFRPNALPVLLAVSCGLGGLAVVRLRAGLRGVVMGLLIGAGLVLAPAVHRCSTLNQRLCPVSVNFAMNVALGQADPRAGLAFAPADGQDYSEWYPPALVARGNTGRDRVPASIFDTHGILSWVLARVAQDPASAAIRALRNAADTFNLRAWPENYAAWSPALFQLGALLFAALVLLPATWGCVRLLRRPLESEPASWGALFGVAAVIGLAGLSMGEARYRYPFDAWWIALAAGGLFEPSAAPLGPRRAYAAGVLGLGAGFAALLLALVFLPQTKLASRLRQADLPVLAAAPMFRRAWELERVFPPGSAWDQGTTILSCDRTCQELRVAFPERPTVTTLSLSTDHNDAYRVTFYKNGAALWVADLPLRRGGAGLLHRRVAIGSAARGFDTLGIQPLYGDGRYSVGHVLVREAARGKLSARSAGVR
ncbi:MAG: hypothetical protein QM778_07390 [Myxococcales bacterium]